MTITIKDKTFSSNISLASILNCMTKVEMLKICGKLELYVSPNLKKEETARRVAREILDNPDDYSTRGYSNHLKRKQIEEFGANEFGLYLYSGTDAKRLEIEGNLIETNDPPCNG